MAIGFGRVEFIKRSEGRNSCQLSAYLSRSKVAFEGNCVLKPKVYDFSHRESVPYHEVILPEGAEENLKIPEVLWNLAERKEVRKDAQVSMHLVWALPDDKEVSIEDKIEMSRSFIQENYPGLIAELVIHPPERRVDFTQDNEALGLKKGGKGEVVEEKDGSYVVSLRKGRNEGVTVEIGKEYTGFSVRENNWHAHAQLTTRRLKDNGKELEDKKATDLMPVVKKGKVISGPDVGKLWAKHQNNFFISKGLALRVDENGLVPQEHLGPVRMRGRAFALLDEHHKRLELNALAASKPKNILNAIVKRQSVFSKEDVERFMLKHVPGEKIQAVRKGFWELEELVQLRSLGSEQLVDKFTAEKVLAEEEQILRLGDRIYGKAQKELSGDVLKKGSVGLSEEQKKAYSNIIAGKGISCIQGYAGTGKSYLLKALKGAYEERGLVVRAFGPDNATADVLKGKGFATSENIYRFLFRARHGQVVPHKGFEVWVLDEAGKLGNRPFLEFLKLAEEKGAKVILAGDSRQLSPVERGGMFKVFCEKYGAEALEVIQRQKDIDSRAMAKNLARGEIGEALDRLSIKGGIVWSTTKKESIEELISKWALDHKNTGQGKLVSNDCSLIIAGTNSEVRVLNEMVRQVRKSRLEIGEREFSCATAYGKIFVSEGDRIEFRKNDRELGVNNGMSGVLLKAEKNRFSVAVQEGGKKSRIVTFDPESYHKFQLGYASTCSRAQGRTVGKAYVLHSSHLNMQMAYVGLTRHIDDVHYFVSKEEALNLSDLKRKALRDGTKSTTLEYTHSRELEGVSLKKEREEAIRQLKNSDGLPNRMKGSAMQLWDKINKRTYDYLEKRYDRNPDPEFFSFKETTQSMQMGEVKEVILGTNDDLMGVSDIEKHSFKEVLGTIISQDKALKEKNEQTEVGKLIMKQEKDIISSEKRENTNSKAAWAQLSKEEKKLVSSYFNAASKASDLRAIVQAECAGNEEEITRTSNFQEWQDLCNQRNKAAYQLKSALNEIRSKEVLQAKSIYYVELHAEKHENVLKAQNNRALEMTKVQDLEDNLSANVESLLYRLFPDGPSSKTASGYRFGKKGSLSVTHSGSKAGRFYDFESQEGGGMVKLISRELKLNNREAINWSKEFLGISDKIQVPDSFKKPKIKAQEASDWINKIPKGSNPAPKFEEQGKLHHYFNETMRHAYRDEGGNLLYYVLRLKNKQDPSKKITPPLSFGHFEDNPSKVYWEYRGYKNENGKKPLYNLQLLREKPLAPVLIVEGEKTADKALEKFPGRDFICMTWSGGASSVSKADWSPLFGREVVVWPDNDEAGFRAATDVCGELKRACAAKVCMVERPELFKKLPPKWDLADPMPEGISRDSLSFLLMDNRKDRLQQGAFEKLGLEKASFTEKLKTSELLFHFEKRTINKFMESLDKDLHGREIEALWKEYVSEAVNFIEKQSSIYKDVMENPSINASGKMVGRLSYQMHLYEAKYGEKPSREKVLSMKDVIASHTASIDSGSEEKSLKEVKELAIHRNLEKVCSGPVTHGMDAIETGKSFKQDVETEMSSIKEQDMRERGVNIAISKQKEIESNISKDIGGI